MKKINIYLTLTLALTQIFVGIAQNNSLLFKTGYINFSDTKVKNGMSILTSYEKSLDKWAVEIGLSFEFQETFFRERNISSIDPLSSCKEEFKYLPSPIITMCPIKEQLKSTFLSLPIFAKYSIFRNKKLDVFFLVGTKLNFITFHRTTGIGYSVDLVNDKLLNPAPINYNNFSILTKKQFFQLFFLSGFSINFPINENLSIISSNYYNLDILSKINAVNAFNIDIGIGYKF